MGVQLDNKGVKGLLKNDIEITDSLNENFASFFTTKVYDRYVNLY